MQTKRQVKVLCSFGDGVVAIKASGYENTEVKAVEVESILLQNFKSAPLLTTSGIFDK